ncbi:transposase, partial [Arachnia propionica]|uniref:transposase n=1 Tax=Arachnia propionica TaxID=1750 RepID=UPI0037BE2C2A
MEHEALTRKAWCRTGVTTVLEVDRTRRSQSYIGFLDHTDGSVELMALDWQNSHTVIEALTQLVENHPDQKITIVWDNAGWHKSRELKQHLGAEEGYSEDAKNYPEYGFDRGFECRVWAAVDGA